MVRRKVRITVCPGEGRRALVRRLRTVGFEQESDNLVFRQPPLASDLQAGVRLSTLPLLRKGGALASSVFLVSPLESTNSPLHGVAWSRHGNNLYLDRVDLVCTGGYYLSYYYSSAILFSRTS